MKSLEVWRRGYKAKFSPGLGRSKCKVSPLPCLPWDSVGGVVQGRFRILHKSGIDSPILWRSPGLSSVRVCWDCWQYGRSAWALALSGVQAGRRSFTVIFWPFLSFPSSLPSLCPLPSISWAVLALLSGCLGDCIGWGRLLSPSVLMLALVAVLASLGAGAGRCPLPVLRPLPLLGAVSGLWCCCLPLPSLLGAGVPLLSSGAGLLCAGAGCWPWVG